MRFTVALVIAVSILVGCTNHIAIASDETPKGVIHVSGKVLCQDCTKGWNEWVQGSKPIQGTCFL